MRGPGFVYVSQLATCKYCGDSQLAWVVSNKTGRPYLAAAFKDSSTDMLLANKFQPHKCANRQEAK